jgi:hypothetical protein
MTKFYKIATAVETTWACKVQAQAGGWQDLFSSNEAKRSHDLYENKPDIKMALTNEAKRSHDVVEKTRVNPKKATMSLKAKQ